MTAQTAAEKVRSRLSQHSFQAFLVGGCVRDLLLGRKPKDFDITTNALPEEVISLFPKTIPDEGQGICPSECAGRTDLYFV